MSSLARVDRTEMQLQTSSDVLGDSALLPRVINAEGLSERGDPSNLRNQIIAGLTSPCFRRLVASSEEVQWSKSIPIREGLISFYMKAIIVSGGEIILV